MKNNDEAQSTLEAQQRYVAPFIRRLMKDATEEEILGASENLRQYLYLLYDIFLAREKKQRLLVEKSKARYKRKHERRG